MKPSKQSQITQFTSEVSARVLGVVTRVAAEPDVKTAVEANHDENRWWPTSVVDWRVRMVVAGWSTRVSYSMVSKYAKVVATANQIGYDQLCGMSDDTLARLVQPIGLSNTRIQYFRSLVRFLDILSAEAVDPRELRVDAFIERFAEQVHQASYKIAQCAALYARGYHCGVMPVELRNGFAASTASGSQLEQGRHCSRGNAVSTRILRP